MDNAGYIVLSRMTAQQRALDVRADNIANMNTPGYKAESTVFSDFLLPQRGAGVPPGGRTVSMVQDRATWRDFSQGQVSRTGNPLDLALTGEGFFAVQTPRGERYTRAGRFALSPAGQVVDMSGNPLLGADGRPLSVPPGDTGITVSGDGAMSSESGEIGTVRVVEFTSVQALQAEGGSLFSSKEPAQPAKQPAVVQGAVEAANSQGVVELSRMMADLREFQFASEFAEAEAQREQGAIDKIGRKS